MDQRQEDFGTATERGGKMRRLLVLGAGLGALALVWAACLGPPARAGGTRANLIRIGLIGSLFRDTPEPMVQVMMRPFKCLMEQQTGVTGQLVSGGDADHLGK